MFEISALTECVLELQKGAQEGTGEEAGGGSCTHFQEEEERRMSYYIISPPVSKCVCACVCVRVFLCHCTEKEVKTAGKSS